MKTIYLDYQASTPVDPRVFSAMQPFFSVDFANPHSSDHAAGWAANTAIESAKTQIASLIDADTDEIIFTSGATESNNLALLGTAYRAPLTRRRILVSAIEHKCVLAAARALRERKKNQVDQIPVDPNGVVDLQKLENLLSDDVLLVSVMTVNNEVGSIQPVKELARLAHDVGAMFHTDAAQAPTASTLDVRDLDIDLLSLSAHKMYGPKGVGVLFLKRELFDAIEPIIYGGGQQQGIRSGTLPTPLCVGFGKAAEILLSEGEEERKDIASLRNQFSILLHECCRDIHLNGPPLESRHPGNLNIRFVGHDARDILARLQPKIAASTGSACTSNVPEPSHVLRAMGLSGDETDASIRFSLGRYTTQNDLEAASEIIASCLSE